MPRTIFVSLDLDLCSSNVQDAFVIAVEQQARERLQRLSALKRITPVDMTKLSKELNQQPNTTSEDLNGFIQSTPIYVTSLSSTENTNNNSTASKLDGNADPSLSTDVTSSEVFLTSSPIPNSSAQPEGSTDQKSNGSANEAAFWSAKSGLNDVRVSCLNDTQSENLAPAQQAEGRRLQDRRVSSPFQNGRTELLIGAEDNKLKTTAIIESNNNNQLGIDKEVR
ncbi:hypothetical protein WA026_020783 [Henosepilachna vigintioctopunctata]|uniref:Uncharacterized protein n=1 Tax=Henosepilachna vigintioctopunctata TaxID=420089 RepID=A0AAW1TY59_9CUCU